MGKDPNNSFSFNGQSYSSAYEAFLFSESGVNATRNFNAYVNSFMIPHNFCIQIVKTFGLFWAHYIISYFRNFIAATFLYYGVSSFFHYHCYIHPRAKEIFKDRKMPSNEIIFDQIKMAQSALFIYSLLPVTSEYIIEEGLSKCVYTIGEMGGFFPYTLGCK